MDTKTVTYKHLHVGQKINKWISGNSTQYASAVVTDINPAYVTLRIFDKEEKVSTETRFEVELTEMEFKNKYREEAKEVMQALQTRLASYEIGYHEMWNGWVSFDPYEMAYYCKKESIKVNGYCSDIASKISMFGGNTLDIGICAEYADGEKFWCHASSDDLKWMFEKYAELIAG